MSTHTVREVKKTTDVSLEEFLGIMFSFNSSLKLIHWDIQGKGSYAAHIALDQGHHDTRKILDRLVETTMATKGDMNIIVPETRRPKDYIAYIEGFYMVVDAKRELFPDQFTQSIIDEYQESIKQMLYRLKRLQ
ncbi:DUF5856 family protein [Chitinophaga sp. sic0106]|uniref:DUF5856 family protein n=1 Tax=Chitinophaga sp. sic0106 TaxID=2854785 RepID=UPI001C46B630|nr:DUF5856 family protein [Chitinophaga sp. sic0106]MBV7529930.1 hypothetical protein [Chitinophaga sp. sic0106]